MGNWPYYIAGILAVILAVLLIVRFSIQKK
jgi:hypothetical protein